MWDTLKNLIIKLFGKKPLASDADLAEKRAYGNNYSAAGKINITAIVAQKLATLTIEESTISIEGDNKRAELLDKLLTGVWEGYGSKAVSMAYGTGMVALVPYSNGESLFIDVVPQNNFIVTGTTGDRITAICVLSDTIKSGDHTYKRFTDYSVEGGSFFVRQKSTCDDRPCELVTVDAWAHIDPEIIITGIDKLPIGFLKCPTDNRRPNGITGVPITYGCDEVIGRILSTLYDIENEYENKRVFVGADSTLFDKNDKLPKSGLFKKFLGENRNGQSFWEIFDPAIRDSSYYTRLQNEYSLLEKSIGVSRGILTEPETHGATATEIKRANHDTYAVVDNMRKQIKSCFEDLADAFNALANYYSLSPMGEYTVVFDWGYALLEDSTETFNQLIQAKSAGAVSKVEVRQFLFPSETVEQAEEAIANITANEPNMSDLLGLGSE